MKDLKSLRAKYKALRLARETKSASKWTKEVDRSGYVKYKDDQGNTIEIRYSTIYGKEGRIRDVSKTKHVGVIDYNGREEKAFSVKGEGYQFSKERDTKVNKYLRSKHGFDFDALTTY